MWPTERAIAIDPLDEEHYLALHRVLADAGRHGAVDRVLTRSPLGHGHRAPEKSGTFHSGTAHNRRRPERSEPS